MFKNTFTLELQDGETKRASLNIKAATDVVMFVPGTTDPTNNKGFMHEANASYWRGKEHNLWENVKKLKPQFLDLHIEDTFFSWSGDNNTEERKKAAERLLDLFLRVYKNWTNREVHLHLIGHSHGGNVINQFTRLIASDSRFPKYWKVKSLVYLSTPFFQKKHQIDHAKIHPKCTVINVYNRYDITQRFIADFSLNNLEGIIQKLSADEYVRITDTIITAMEQVRAAFDAAYGSWDWVINNDTEGPLIWRRTVTLLDRIREFTTLLIKDVGTFQPTSLQQEVLELKGVLVAIDNWVGNTRNTFAQNQEDRDGGYGPTEFVADLNIMGVVGLLNRILAIDGTVESSALIDLLARIFREQHDIVDSIDNTLWHPKNQIQGKYPITFRNITEEDEYHTRKKTSDFERFASGVEGSLEAGNLHEVLMWLISQFIDPEQLGTVIMLIDHMIEPFVFGEADDQMEELRLNITDYRDIIRRFNCDLIAEQDADKGLEAPGSVPYLAMVSHSLSHTHLWDEVDEGLRDSFSSGENPGYKG